MGLFRMGKKPINGKDKKVNGRRIIDPVVRAYGMTDVERLTGLSRITLHVWDQTGFVSPSIVSGGLGTGNRRKYSFADIVSLRVAKQLREAGISLQALRKVARYLKKRDQLENPFAERMLAVQGADVVMVGKEEIVSLLDKPGQYSFILHLDLKTEAEALKRDMLIKAA